MELPTVKSKPITEFSQYSTLIYGAPKIGKSTFCSHAEGALFIATEPGLNTLEVFKIDIQTWDEFLDACKSLVTTEHDFKTIVIDTIDNLYMMCEHHVCQKYEVEYLNDGTLSYGKGFAIVLNEFKRVMTKLASLPFGLILTSHAFDKEIESRMGKYTKTVPTIPDAKKSSPYKFVTGLVDIILFCDQERITNKEGQTETVRIIRTKPSLAYDAGDRSGKLPGKLPLDFKEFVKYFEPEKETKGVKKS